VLNISFTDEDMTVDGMVTETIWKTVEPLSDLKQNEPTLGAPASLKTVIKATYNNRMIYFAVECDDPEVGRISASAKRDGAIGNDDSIVIVLDTFNDKSNAYLFAVNSLGTRFDAKITDNGRSWDLKWDRNWKAACKVNDIGWTAEIGIPFDEIAFDKHTTIMGFNVVRNIPRSHEEAFLVLNLSNLWMISEFGEIVSLDLSRVDSEHYEANRAAHFDFIKKNKKIPSDPNKYTVKENLPYKSGSNLSNYEKERCLLDLYIPKGRVDFPVIVWFHGGSLERCSKDDDFTREMAGHFAQRGVAVAVVNYRLSPNANYPSYIEDASTSVAWVVRHIDDYDGNSNAVFIAGHSAGGYLTYMLGMDRKYLKAVDVGIDQIAGLIPIGGQTFTHYTIRKERGIPNPETTPVIDEASPCYHAKASGPPVLAICGDGDTLDRIEENKYLLALLRRTGYTNTEYREMKDRTHWDLILKIPTHNDPVSDAVLDFVAEHSRSAD
jgi:acetyl esterase/lipase